MTTAASGALAATIALDGLAREDRGRLLAVLISRLRDFQLAEDALQDAMISAVAHWARNGLPASPKGWLLQVAYRKAIDRIRQRKSEIKRAGDLAPLAGDEAHEDDPELIPDERLRLIFTCCHPAIELKSQVALTLRTLGGLSTPEIARAFLDQEATMGQRLSRAKAKIAAARIPYAVPGPEEWPERLKAVLSVVYLIFNAGYTAGPGEARDLADEAIWLGRMLDRLSPEDPEIEGFLALMLLTRSRFAARNFPDGATIPLLKQDRNLWIRDLIDEGSELVTRALRRRRPGPYQIKAAIAACHCDGETSDWPQIAALYGALMIHEPTPVVRLNHAIAMAETGALEFGLSELKALRHELEDYQPFHAAAAELHARAGDLPAARCAFARAIVLAQSAADAVFLQSRMAALTER
jgi:RNA polymerase sigma factor (sigma-70 family)